VHLSAHPALRLTVILSFCTKFPLQFTDIHWGFSRVSIRLVCFGNSVKLAPFPLWLAFPTAEYYGASDAQ
jgi:hypothetical protein